jgi:hypothetical protein
MPVSVAIAPVTWSIIGVMPVVALDLLADVGRILSGAIRFPLILLHNRKLVYDVNAHP